MQTKLFIEFFTCKNVEAPAAADKGSDRIG